MIDGENHINNESIVWHEHFGEKGKQAIEGHVQGLKYQNWCRQWMTVYGNRNAKSQTYHKGSTKNIDYINIDIIVSISYKITLALNSIAIFINMYRCQTILQSLVLLHTRDLLVIEEDVF